MKIINKGAKIGIFIEIIVVIVMIVLVLSKQIIPDIIMWVFTVGLVVVFASILIELSKKHKDRT